MSDRGEGGVVTIVKCPHGCGGTVNTAIDNYCNSCRRDLAAIEVIIPEDADSHDADDPTVARKASWCWAWWGPKNHRMRCRLPRGHLPVNQHDTHEQPIEGNMIISTDGELIA
jgi:hypothetical protein